MTAARKARLSKQNDSRPRFLLPQPRSDKPQLTVSTAKKAKPKSPHLGSQNKTKRCTSKRSFIQTRQHAKTAKSKSSQLGWQKTKQRRTSKRSFIQTRQHAKTAKNAKPKVTATRLAKTKQRRTPKKSFIQTRQHAKTATQRFGTSKNYGKFKQTTNTLITPHKKDTQKNIKTKSSLTQ